MLLYCLLRQLEHKEAKSKLYSTNTISKQSLNRQLSESALIQSISIARKCAFVSLFKSLSCKLPFFASYHVHVRYFAYQLHQLHK